jgi:hypothetical protein
MHWILLSLFSIAMQLPLAASAHINTEDFSVGKTTRAAFQHNTVFANQSLRSRQHEEKRWSRLEKRLTKINDRLSHSNQQRIEGLSDTTDRWFWLWTFGWGTGLLLTLLSGGAITSGFLGIVWMIGFGFGSASLIIWLLKRFQ